MSSSRSRFSFSARRAIVTGGCRGIGRAIADQLCSSGAEVEVFDLAEPEVAPFPHRFTRVDVADSASVMRAMGALRSTADLIVNNAGITRDRSLAKMSDEEWAAVLNVNLTGAFNMIRAAAPAMAAKNYGRIVNITSINGLRGKFGQANYAAARKPPRANLAERASP